MVNLYKFLYIHLLKCKFVLEYQSSSAKDVLIYTASPASLTKQYCNGLLFSGNVIGSLVETQDLSLSGMYMSHYMSSCQLS